MTRKYIRRAQKTEKRKYAKRAIEVVQDKPIASTANAAANEVPRSAAPVIRTEPELRELMLAKLAELNRIDGSIMAMLGPAPHEYANKSVLAERLISYVNNVLAPDLISVLDQIFISRGYVLQASAPAPEITELEEAHPADVAAVEAIAASNVEVVSFDSNEAAIPQRAAI